MTDAHNTAPADPRVYIAQSLEGMKAATAAHCGSWHLDQAERWSVDMDEGLIRFVLPDGMHASAPVHRGHHQQRRRIIPVGLGSPVRAAGTGRTRRTGAALRRSPWIA